MKKKNQKIAAILIISILISSISFSGCGESQENISVGQWLSLVNQTFGMESYQSDTPYFDNISQDSSYFDTVQTAAEWDVIDTAWDINVDEMLTWNMALLTLVNVGNFTPEDTSEEDKIEYAIEHFDNSIRNYWMKRYIAVDKAIFLLGIAHEQWAKATYDHVIEEVTYQENVLDLTGEEINLEGCIIEDNLIKIPVSSGVVLEAGQVYVLPADREHFGVQAYKADKVYQDEQYIYIENSSDEMTLEDVAEEVFVEETFVPAMDKAIVYDGNGNVLSVGSALSPVSDTKAGENRYATNLLAGGEEYRGEKLANTQKKEIKVDGFTIYYEYAKSGSFYFKAGAESDNLLDSSDIKMKAKVSAEISNLEVTAKVDWGIFKGLKSAMLKLDYQTKLSGGIESSFKPPEMVFAPYDNRNSSFWTNLKGSSLKSRTAKGAKTIKIASMDIYSIGVARVCLDINLRVEANGSFTITVTESGAKGLEYKNSNLRVINESKKDTDAQLKGSIELTGGIGPALYVIGLKKKIIGAQIRVGVGGEGSVTVHLADSEMHLIDEMDFGNDSPEAFTGMSSASITAASSTIEAVAKTQGGFYESTVEANVLLHADVCVDIGVYFILKIQVDGDSYATGMIKELKKAEWEIFGKKNAKLFCMHVDNWDWTAAFANMKIGLGIGGAPCMLQYMPFDKDQDAEETEADEAETENAGESNEQAGEQDVEAKGDMIVLDSVMLAVAPEEKSSIVVLRVPGGYSLGDLRFQSSNEKIVAVDVKGNLTGISEGSAIVTISTSDGKYKTYCAVTVLSGDSLTFTPVEV